MASGSDAPTIDVLVARSDASARHLCAAFLQDRGFALRFARDADEARAMCAATLPACVVLDESLPPSGGITLVEELRRAHGAAALGILVLGAPKAMYDQIHVLRRGADEYLRSDELTPAVLERALRAVVDRLGFRRLLGDQHEGLATARADVGKIADQLARIASNGRLARARIADELRTQAGVIANALEMLDTATDPQEELALLSPVMRRAVARLDHLAESLCDLDE